MWDEDENSVKVQSNSVAESEKNNATLENMSNHEQEEGEDEIEEHEDGTEEVDEILTRRKQTDKRAKKRKQQLAKEKKAKLKKFADIEAELGSDDEGNDEGKAKSINSDDDDENEDGLDEDLKGFVVQGQDEEIGGANDEMMQKFLRDREADDRAEVAKVYSSIILGNNRKRKRGDIELDDMDELSKKKQKRIEQRLQEDWDDEQNDQMVEIDLKAVRQGEEESEDEMSETERQIKEQNNDYFKAQKLVMSLGGEQKLYSRFTDLKLKQRQEEEELMAMMI